MSLNQNDLEKVIFREGQRLQRFTQDSPIYPDVWLQYITTERDARVELLLTPHRQYSAGEVLVHLRDRLRDTGISRYSGVQESPPWHLASSGGAVAADLTFEELIRAALPLTRWWQEYLWDEQGGEKPDLCWLRGVAGAVAWSQQHVDREARIEELEKAGELASAFDGLIQGLARPPGAPPCLWSVSLNRPVFFEVRRSVPATKADAARRLFDVDGSGICWAVIDSGVDAQHRAFRRLKGADDPFADPGMEQRGIRRPNHTRIVATYDFTRLRDLMSDVDAQTAASGEAKRSLREELAERLLGRTGDEEDRPLTKKQIADLVRDLERTVKSGRVLDWSAVGPLLRIPHNQDDYEPPKHPHGTHVAGILGADTRAWENHPPLVGMCPGIEFYDLRVMGPDGTGDEFTILAALQFVRWLNAQRDQLAVHGVNVSLAMHHRVANFACGCTPVCEECRRLTAEGVVVVAAAGNRGRAIYLTKDGQPDEGFRTVSITDPGNAEEVITVGATHRFKPHAYGVSYFSSRGPTGDGRVKPDLLAPGEKITSAVPGGGRETMDGTSMAAPHVSGAAALLLAQHHELVGRPQRVKQVLCQSATDLGRERYFQGHGMLDTLRALQSL